jgi:hypothetical protein
MMGIVAVVWRARLSPISNTTSLRVYDRADPDPVTSDKQLPRW